MEILQIEVFYPYGYIAWTLNESIVPIYVCNAPKKYSMWSIFIYWYDLLKKSNGLKVEIGTTIQILQFEELPYVLSKYGKWLFAKYFYSNCSSILRKVINGNWNFTNTLEFGLCINIVKQFC